MRTSKRGLEVVVEEGGESWNLRKEILGLQSNQVVKRMRKLRRRPNHLDMFVN
jgi:hypothetical protein